MAQNSNRNGHRNGGRVKVPTSEREMARPNNFSTSVSNTPDFILYGVSFVLLAFGASFLIVGAVYAGQCEIQPMLPIWLLVMGIIIMVKGVIFGIYVKRTKQQPFRSVSLYEKAMGALTMFIFLAWFIAGNVWIYKAWAEIVDYGHYWFSNGCNKSVFILSFCAIITLDAFVGIFIIGVCFWGVTKIVVRE